MSFTEQLISDYKENRADFSDNFRLKIHRTLSWLKKANEEENLDFKFISLWIAFNAAYADELKEDLGDRNAFQAFLKHLCNLDRDFLLYDIIWDKYQDSVLALLDTPYTFQPFWEYHNGDLSKNDWRKMFTLAKNKAKFAFNDRETIPVLDVIFRHLYTLRNQLLHGGATYESSANRKQLQDACDLLSHFVPAIVQIMLNNPNDEYWGKPYYPYVNVAA